MIDIFQLQHLAVGDNWLPAFERAKDDLGLGGGVITTSVPMRFRIDGTLDLTTQIALDFGTNNNGGTGGAHLYSEIDAPILRYPGGNRFVQLRNISIVGAGLPNQHGIVIANGGIWAHGVTIRNCHHGIFPSFSYAGRYDDFYISHCAGDGVHIEGNVGANTWTHIVCAANGGNGINLHSMNGSDLFLSPITEQNACHGVRIGSAAGNRGIFGYSELNALGPLRFESGAVENHWNFASFGWSEPVNVQADLRNGTRNAYDGRQKDCEIRHMLAGKVGYGQIDNPQAALDVDGGMAVSGWKVLGYQGSVLHIGGIASGQWNELHVMTDGTSKQQW